MALEQPSQRSTARETTLPPAWAHEASEGVLCLESAHQVANIGCLWGMANRVICVVSSIGFCASHIVYNKHVLLL